MEILYIYTRDKKRFKEQGYKIPTVIPIVLYTGKRKWKKLSINDIEETIEGYQENWLEYTLIDANKFSKEKVIQVNNEWDKKFNILTCFLEHDELEKVKTQLVAITAGIDVEDTEYVYEEIKGNFQ